MAILLKGQAVVDALNEKLTAEIKKLKAKDIHPTIGIIRVGERTDDVAYERGAMKRAEKIGILVKKYLFPEHATQGEILAAIEQINQDCLVHGVLIFRPLPEHLDDAAIRRALLPSKDVDGVTDGSMAGVYSGTDLGFPPCTPTACMEILDYYGIDVTGKKAVVIGRSLVVGKPAALMLMKKNATVTICHTKTVDMVSICKNADILMVATGKAKSIGAEYCHSEQIVIDVGINLDEDGKLCGDVDFDAVEPFVKAITPVPGGVGTVTTSLLMKHVVEAAKKAAQKDKKDEN